MLNLISVRESQFPLELGSLNTVYLGGIASRMELTRVARYMSFEEGAIAPNANLSAMERLQADRWLQSRDQETKRWYLQNRLGRTLLPLRVAQVVIAVSITLVPIALHAGIRIRR